MSFRPENPLIVQSNREVLLEVHSPRAEAAREAMSGFAELLKSPEHIHTYRITPLSLWNAAASGVTAAAVLSVLEEYTKYPLPEYLHRDVADQMARYGRVKLVRRGPQLLLVSEDPRLLVEISRHKQVRPYIQADLGSEGLLVDPDRRGHLKMAMTRMEWPVEDLAGYVRGAPLELGLAPATRSGAQPFHLRRYQEEAVHAFYRNGGVQGGSGVVVLPCGAGKTVVALAAIAAIQAQTLILTTNITAVRQFIAELLDKTSLPAEWIGEYTGEVKEVRPVTVTTYQILTYRDSVEEDFPHFQLFNRMDWGLIIYDEVHLLPAPVFRVTAEIQARRRLGLTATLVREDGREEDVFSLIGPKRYDVPWKVLERQGFIAPATCHEIRLALPEELRMQYAVSDDRAKYRIAAENPAKLELVQELVRRHAGERVLIIGQYLDQLRQLSAGVDAPLITGQTPTREREELYARFREGDLYVLVVSKVANFAIDLPDASVLIQVSGTFGSRQEEAQRLGRVLRPKPDGRTATFYTLVTRETREEPFARNRQGFLTEQGYRYLISHAEELMV